MFDEMPHRAPVLVLGIGNTLLRDDGTGIELLASLSKQSDRWGNDVEFFDGGTGGIALLGPFAGRRAVILLDAVELGAEPGTLHVMEKESILALDSHSSNAHEGNIGELLRSAWLLGDLPDHLILIGVEPGRVETGIGLTGPVQGAVPSALNAAAAKIDSLLMSRSVSSR